MVKKSRMVAKRRTKKTTNRRAARKPATSRKAIKVVPATVLQASEVPAIAKPWEGQGGIRAAEMRGEEGQPNYHLILVCGEDGKPIVLEEQPWGVYGKELPKCDFHNDSLANTDAMVKGDSALAKKAREFGVDCSVPCVSDLQAIRANCRHLLPKGWYWSSTQYSAYYAWCQGFDSGTTDWDGKDSKLRAVVVRRVPIQ